MGYEKYYNDGFYRTRYEKTKEATNAVLDHLLKIIPAPHSAADLGCGVGAWLAALRERGVTEVVGIDGPWVNRDHVVIPQESFLQQNLAEPLNVSRRFDLAISLEVAEHLPANSADAFVANLVSLSDFVLFSAAPPLQGGKNHINEQLIGYWVERFEKSEYVALDVLRPYLWDDARIGPWYRQNMLLFVKATRLGDLNMPAFPAKPASYLHPEIYLEKLQEARTIKGAWKLLRRALKRRLGISVN